MISRQAIVTARDMAYVQVPIEHEDKMKGAAAITAAALLISYRRRCSP